LIILDFVVQDDYRTLISLWSLHSSLLANARFFCNISEDVTHFLQTFYAADFSLFTLFFFLQPL